MTGTDKNCPHCGIHIDDHPASRCLAKWVAVDVMDFRYIALSPDDEQRPLVPPAYAYSEELDELRKEDYRRWWQGRDPDYLVPDYPNDIAAAWDVLEKLSKHYYVDIGVDDDGAQVQLDCLHVDSLGNTQWRLAFVESTRAETAPHAICRVAIKTQLESESIP